MFVDPLEQRHKLRVIFPWTDAIGGSFDFEADGRCQTLYKLSNRMLHGRDFPAARPEDGIKRVWFFGAI